MRVLLTGATGFIGRRLIARLADEGHWMTAMLLPSEPEPDWGATRIVRGDITDPASLEGKLVEQDAVVHLAGAVGYGQTFKRCNEINRDGTANIAREACAAGIRRFLHMSSVSVYGRVAGRELSEDAPLRKIGDPYGDTKIDAERILGTLADEGKLDLTIIRPTVIYGPGDDKFLPKLVENLKTGTARIIGSGNNTVDLVHVDDAVELITKALVDPRAVGGVYNLSNPDNPSWKTMLTAMAEELGVPAPTQRLPYPIAMVAAALIEMQAWLKGETPRLTRYAVRVIGRQYHYSIERAREELGYEPRVELLDGLRQCLAAMQGTQR